MTEKKKPQPWAQLYDIESNPGKRIQSAAQKTAGRPKNIVRKSKATFTLTDGDLRLINDLRHELADNLHPGKVYKGQIIGLALRITKHFIDKVENYSSWEDLAETIMNEDFYPQN